jgi:hypothetical protein
MQLSPWIEVILPTATSNQVQKITFAASSPFLASEIHSCIDLRSRPRFGTVFLAVVGVLYGAGERLETAFNALAPGVVGVVLGEVSD